MGLSAYALFGTVIHTNLGEVSRLLGKNTKATFASVLLLAFGILFAFKL